VHQHLSGIDRTLDLNAPSPFDRTAPGQVRSVAAANATRPILPVNGGVRQVNVLTNLGVADYDGLADESQLPRQLAYVTPQSATRCPKQPIYQRTGRQRHWAERSATLAAGESNADRAWSTSVDRAVITFSYRFPLPHHGWHHDTAHFVASFNATEGVTTR